MEIRKFSVAVLVVLTFPYLVPAIENIEGERGPEEPPVVKHAEKTESPLLEETTNQGKELAHILRLLEDADVVEITDDDVRAALKILAAQVRHLNERVDRLDNSKTGPSTKPGEQVKSPRDMAIKLESLMRQQASKQAMLGFLEKRSETAGGPGAAIRSLLTRTKQDLKDIADEIADLELNRSHDDATVESIVEFAAANYLIAIHSHFALRKESKLFDPHSAEIWSKPEHALVEAEIISTKGRESTENSITDYERQLLDSLRNVPSSNRPEVLKANLHPGETTYYRVIRIRKSCIVCHAAHGLAAGKPDNIIGMFKLTIPNE